MPRMKLWKVVAVAAPLLCPALAAGGWHDGECNKLGRCLGLGWSDGYHARHLCPQACCGMPKQCCWTDACPPAPCGQPTPAAFSAGPPPMPAAPTPAMALPAHRQAWAPPPSTAPYTPMRGVQLPPASSGYGGGYPAYTVPAAPVMMRPTVPPAIPPGPQAQLHSGFYAPGR